jgi:polyketide synthase PksN
MIDFIDYVVAELKSKRLSKKNAVSLVRQFTLRSSGSLAASVIHPLLHRNTSDLSEQRYSSTFTGEEFFLADHQVRTDGRAVEKVLPGVVYLEMVRAGIEQAWPARPESAVLELRNNVWAQPLVIDVKKTVSLALVATDNGQIDYEVYSEDAGGRIIHCHGSAVWSRKAAPASLDLKQLREEMGQGRVEPNMVYAACAQMGLVRGPAFHAITAIHQGNDQVLAQLRLPEAVDDTWGDYVLHPSLMDGALQASLGMIEGESELFNQTRLPFALESMRIVSPCTREMFAWVRYSPSGVAGKMDVKPLDIDLCDERGNICVEIQGFSSLILKSEEEIPVAPRQEIQAGLQLFVPVWNLARLDAHRKAVLSESAKTLLLGGDQTQLDWVRESHANACLLPLPPAATIDIIESTLRESSFDHLLWIAPDVTGPDGRSRKDDDRIIEQQELGVMAVFRIIKALLRLGYGAKELRWTIITGKTQQVKKDEPIQPAHAGIFGLVGALAKEYPYWNLSLLDVDSLESVSASECLSMAPDKQGNGLACRDREWFYQEFSHIPKLPPSPPVHYRQEGVYVVIGGAGGLGEVWTRFMMERYQANVVWIGRHQYNSSIEEKVNSLTRAGHAPLYISADATNLDALEQACKTILKTWPVIHGVIHSAIVLQGQGIARMEEPEFKASLSAKVDISVNMDKVFGGQELDFMLFFSSIISFYKAPGQSNYAAGCIFKDSFAQNLQLQRSYPVKILNWGYWGTVGVVADEYYNKTMEAMGVGSIEPDEGMASLQTFIDSELNQLAVIKMIDAQTIVSFSERQTYYPADAATLMPEIPGNAPWRDSTRQLLAAGEALQTAAMDALMAEILASTLMSLGLFREGAGRIADLSLEKPPAPFYERWLSSSIRYLREHKFLGDDFTVASTVRPLDNLWLEWEEGKSAWAVNPDLRAQLVLLDACLKGLSGILSGRQLATDVMFPRSSMHLVEGVYRGNVLADHFNEILGGALLASIEQMLRGDKGRKLRILEVGAGTGGTTAKLLPLLQRFPVEEYCYTDISRAFLMHAEERYQPGFPALTTAIFDVSRPLATQSIAGNRYDVVIAANVLHATPNIREALRNAKAALKNKGILLLNEVSSWSLFAHLTFGLLEGWWLYEDSALRLPDGPGLLPEKWREILTEEGFESIFFPAEEAHKFGQQIIAASSNGWARQPFKHQPVVVFERKPLSSVAAPAASMKASAGAEESLREKSTSYFQKVVGSTLKMRSDQLDPRRPLTEYGLDSILVGQLTYQLRKAFADITSTLFFEVQSIDGLVDYFLENKKEELLTALAMTAPQPQLPPGPVAPESASAQSARKQRSFGSARIAPEPKISAAAQAFPAVPGSAAQGAPIFDVAVIGLSGRYPQSRNLKEFWINLSNGVSCITEIPGDRWNWKKYYDAEKGKTGKIYTQWGGFLNGIDQFDPLFFRISPQEAKRMDPQERVFLESCYHAMEDAGYTPEGLGKSAKIGVFVGVMNSRYTPQPLHSSIANRVSYLFNFQGPSIAVDTACSASLTAIHLALESIYSGVSECAIAGGVNLIVDPVHFIQLTELTMLSSGNRCKAFGEQADGFVDAEGVGAVVLKPLQQAQRDGDHIYGVLKGSAINAGGRTNGYTVPNPIAQARLVAQALERANVTAEQLSYIEAHGTGTALGDPIEIAGLTRAFRETSDKKQFCSIGSLKSNIGHCESAAGIAGLTKVLLQLKYEQLVPSLHAEIPNPEIDFSRTPFKVQKSLEKWRRPTLEVNGVMREIPRMAGVSSFGAGGANAHVIVQEYLAPAELHKPAASVEGTTNVIILSARNAAQLKQKASDLLDFIGAEEHSIDLAAMAYTLQVGREAMEERLGLVVSSIEQVVEKLHAYVAGEQGIEDVYQGQVKPNQEVWSLFSTDAELKQTVGKWLAGGKLSRLLELWVKGGELDWSRLYDEARPRRMSLPVYPFARERHWIESAAVGLVAAQGSASAVLHPLLHRNTSDLSEQRYSSTFTGEEFFLADHQVKVNGHAGQKVLPGVAYLEMARAAIEQAWRERPESAVLELRNIVWAQPIVVGDVKQISIALLANDNEQIDFEIYSEDGEEAIVHCQGSAVWSRHAAPARLDVEQLMRQTEKGRMEPGGVYSAFTRMGLVHGASFQGITAIHRGNGHVLAHLRLPKAAGDTLGDYVLHPGLMDSALQAAVGLIEDEPELSKQPRLPFALESLRIVSACTTEMFAWLRYSSGSQASDHVARLDIDLCDEAGNVCAQMCGLCSRVLSKEISTTAAQGKVKGSLLATPVWKTSDVEASTGARNIAYTQHHVIVCELPNIDIEKLGFLLPKSQCLSLRAGERHSIAQRYSDYALACFERIQSILRNGIHDRVLVHIVVAGHQEQIMFAGLSALLKTAALENPWLIGQLILAAPEMTTGELAGLLQTEKSGALDTLIRFQNGLRQVLCWEVLSVNLEKAPIAFQEQSVYLITGGLGGLGLLFAREILTQTRHARVILTGRSVLSTEKQALLDGLSAPTGRLSYRQVDIGNLDQARQLIAAIKNDYGQLNGILHSAGQIADNFILKKTGTEFSEVLTPKVSGTYNLDQASQDVELDFFVLFSSAAAATGNPGQADYAAANGFMDQFAAYRNGQVAAGKRHGRTRSINWGLWQAGGMGMQMDAARRELLRQSTGMDPMSAATGMDAFHRSLALSCDQMLVMEGDRARMRRAYLDGPALPPEPQPKTPAFETGMDSDRLAAKTQDYLRRQFSELSQLAFHRIDPLAPLENYGIDSILAMKLTNRLEKTFGSLPKTLFFEYQTIAGLTGYFVKAYPSVVREKIAFLQKEPKPGDADRVAMEKTPAVPVTRTRKRFSGSRANHQKDIAVIGLAGRYPQAENLWEFWKNLQDGRDCITEIPLERWDNELYYDSSYKLGKSYSKWGGFIADVDKFDPLFFNISPKEAELIDPQERLFLETVWETIEDAGYSKKTISGKRVGVYAGVMWGQYELLGVESILNENFALPNSSRASIANRVSYFFDFHGPSVALDTMCSSSLTAIHLACEELRKGEIEAAIAGGVNVAIHPYKYLSLSQGKFIASDGKCRSFGEGGDGYVPGEGVGAVLLKRLENALRDGDHIYAVIKSSTVNHGGKTNGYSVPNPNAQADLILDALRKASIDPKTLSYVEAHGTGTSLGDPIEIAGLMKAFESSAPGKQFCPIGSVKSNIGHLESAAGIAAVTKALLQIRHRQLVPSLHADPLNPNINFADSPFYVQTQLTEWKNTAAHPRRVGVSSFGAGGSNAHLILEEYLNEQATERTPHLPSPEIFVLSARDKDALCRYAEKIVHFLENPSGVSLADVAYTSQVGRTPMDARLVVITSSLEDLRAKLSLWTTLRKNHDLNSEGNTQELEGVFNGNIREAQNSAGNLIEGRAGKVFLADLLVNGDLEKIARLWILGVEIDWSLMGRNTGRRKVSLPTYAFAKERCWVNQAAVGPRVVQKIALNPRKVAPREQPEERKRTYYFQQWTLKALAAPEGKPAAPGPILMLDASEELFLVMKEKADPVILVKPGKSFQEIGPGIYVMDTEREEHFTELVENLKKKSLLPGVVLHHSPEVCNLKVKQQIARQLNNGIYALFYLCRALMKEKHKALKIISVFSSHSEASAPIESAVVGFFKTLTLENPRYLAKVVDVQRGPEDSGELPPSLIAGLIWNELHDQDWTEHEIRYRRHGEGNRQEHARYISGLVSNPPVGRKLSTLPLKQQGVYVITGGLGGLGFIFAEYLARNFEAKLVLVGRSGPKPGHEERLSRLRDCGGEVLVLKADVSQLEDMEMVVGEAKTRFLEINGVIHAAGMNRDAFILKKTKEEMDAVLAPKVYGAINVDLATSGENLDLFVLFSSVAGVMGNIGQSDYAYANHFLDSFTESRENLRKAQKRSGRTLSINWPLWEEGGMGLSGDGIALLEKQTGICPLPTQEGIRYWEDFLRSEALQCVALYGSPSRIAAHIARKSAKASGNVPSVREGVDAATLLAKTEVYLKAMIGEEIKLAPERIGSSDRLESFGIDSVMINRMNTRLERDIGALPKTLLYQHETVRELANFLMLEAREALVRLLGFAGSAVEPAIPSTEIEEEAIQEEMPSARERDDLEPIAIIGIHGYFPHSANLNEYWENLKQGKDLIDLVPSTRWDCDELYHSDPAAAADGKIYCKWGGFLDDYDKFDPRFFNISAEEARIIDPQERLFLESVWAAIEDAGYTRYSLKERSRKARSADVGVFVGVTTNSYHLWAPEERSRGNIVCPSALPWSIANRVSYFFDFNGPSLPVDTACSSSLVAVHLACESLKNRECQVAIAGGVNLYLHPSKYHSLCQRRMLSLDGKCHSYGAGDNGFVPGEGVGTLVLKPLSRAIEHQDRIYAVIPASAFDHSGRSNGYSAPNPNSQANLISHTLRKAHIHPETIGYVEGHGTGTQLGDSIEIAALTQAFEKQTAKKQFCPIGSVKANIGHAESAAGIASLAKVILQIKHRQLAPSIYSDEANPNIEFRESPFYLQHGLSEWEASPLHPRRALINSFGAGGVNACIILEEYEKRDSSDGCQRVGPRLFTLSARNEDRLREYADRLLGYLRKDPDIDLANLCFTLQVGREGMEERLATVVSEVSELIDRLSDWIERGLSADIHRGSPAPRLASQRSSEPAKKAADEQTLTDLAALWAAGEEVDWESLYASGKPQRIGLPGYPFARERYWISTSMIPEKNAFSGTQLHPLISWNSSTLKEVSFSSALSDSSFYAVDHRVNAEKIFPGAGFLEMACMSGNIAGEQRVRKITDVVWVQPLIFRKSSQMLRTSLKHAGDFVEYIISSLDDENETVLHSEGRLVFRNGRVDPTEVEESMPIQALKAQCASPEDGAAYYRKFKKYGVDYGPSFQTIQEIYVNSSFALSRLKIADHLKGDFGQFLLHPSMIDGALQTVAGLAGGLESETPWLPVALDEVDIIHPVRQTCYAYAEFADSHEPNRTGVRKFNIRLLNESGDVLIKFTNLFFRAISNTQSSHPSPVAAGLAAKPLGGQGRVAGIAREL